jgi:DNA invertase Pin-like site-specific DNA recombinase
MTKALAYLRVSGKSQIKGDGFDRQIDAIDEFAAKQCFEVVSVYRDEAIKGGTEVFSRPAFSQMVEAAEYLGIDAVIVERSDRLARDLIESEIMFREARERGIRIFAADTGEELVFTDTDPSRKLIRQILGALAEWEKSVIVKKLSAARARKRAETGRCEGVKPYGKDAQEREIISTFKWASLWTPRDLMMHLNDKGYRTRFGKLWTAKQVRRVRAQIEKEK